MKCVIIIALLLGSFYNSFFGQQGIFLQPGEVLNDDGINTLAQGTAGNPWFDEWIVVTALVALIAGFLFVFIHRKRLLYQKRRDQITIEGSKSKMVFLTELAQEMRTPLSLILSPVEDMVRTNEERNPEWKQNLRLVHRNARYLLRMINQIIDFNKPDSGDLQLEPMVISLNRLIRDVAANFQEFEHKNDIEINLDLPESDLIAKVDPQKIEEILYTLISNAFKNARPKQVIVISLRIVNADRNLPAERDYLVLSVFNQGLPEEGENKEPLFERFYRINEQEEDKGSGFSYVKSLAELHGGFIQVKSHKRKGISFHVYLPFYAEMDVAEKESPESVFAGADNRSTFFPGSLVFEEHSEKFRIVLVEDNAELRRFLMQVLARTYECYAFDNGHEALEAIRDFMPDVVLAEVGMPDMDGLMVCRSIKENRSTCHIPVILLTARDAESHMVEGFGAGADAYITKPFSTNVLLAQLSGMIHNRELIREKYLKQNFMVEIADSLPSRDDAFIASLRRILEEHVQDADFNVNRLSKQMNISSTQLYRKVKALTGYSPVEFMRIVKLQKACDLLKQRKNTVKEVCFLVGFNNLSYFVKCFREFFGVTPAVFRDQGLTDFGKPETNSTPDRVN
jgi:signal transduction histidine kinase/AraC-like DNA-binding protein